MSPKRKKWPQSIIKSLSDNLEFVKIYVIPGTLFFLDFTFRTALGINLIDAGADMALLAVATFLALVMEDNVINQKQYIPISLLFVVIFLVPWILCLRIIAIQEPITITLLRFVDFRLIFSWLIGILAFVFSGILSNTIIQKH